MSEKKAETDDLDSGWDADEDPAPTTRAVGSLDLLRQAGMSRHPSRPFQAVSASSEPPAPPKGPRTRTEPDLRATVPPPVPASEYVATMMGQVPESETRQPGPGGNFRQPALPTLAERHRAILQTLHEEDPLRFDFDEGIDVSLDEEQADEEQADEAPTIEMSEAAVEDMDPELLIETPIPPRPAVDSWVTQLDDLPVDEVLLAVSKQPAAPLLTQRSRPNLGAGRPGASAAESPAGKDLLTDEPVGAGGPGMFSDPPLDPRPAQLRVPNIPSFEVSEGDPEVHERDTIAGYDPNDPLDRVHDRFVVGDYSGALVIAEGVLEEDPSHAEAAKYADSCRDMLRQMYLSRIGSGKHVAAMAMGPEQLRWLTLDHRAGFLLSCIDGKSSIDEILDVSGMPPLDALRILYELVQEGVIAVRDPE